jgi:hypothetical protein
MIKLIARLLLVPVAAACTQGPDFSARFDVQRSRDGHSVLWSLRLSRDQYHRMLDTTDDRGGPWRH